MPAVAVCGIDIISTGHPCDSTAGIQGSLQSKVKIGGNSVAVQGDSIQVHDILVVDKCLPHGATISGGSSKVFINNTPIARVGDSADSGSIITGSSKVYAGG
jgi:uncharacterized Zn-binding protein involved in type VI secretion